MLNKFFLTLAIAFIFTPTASAEMLLFVGEECPYCQELKSYLQENDLYTINEITELEIYHNEENQALYLETAKALNYTAGGVPLLVNGEEYIEGNNPIREYLAQRPQEELEKFSLSTEDQNELKNILDEQSAQSKIPTIIIGLIIAGILLFAFRKH